VDTVIRIGVLTPHEVAGPEPEFAAMAPGRLATRVARVTGSAGAAGRGGPTSPADLGTLATAPFPDRAARQLLTVASGRREQSGRWKQRSNVPC
jgi:hypothetical protein